MKTFKVTVDNQTYTVTVEELSGNRTTKPGTAPSGPSPAVSVPSPAAAPVKEVPAKEKKPEEAPKPVSTGGYTLKAPMPGSVLEVKVRESDPVKEGDVLLVLEAMKMENELTASQAGTVEQVLVKKGDTVNSGDPLIVLS